MNIESSLLLIEIEETIIMEDPQSSMSPPPAPTPQLLPFAPPTLTHLEIKEEIEEIHRVPCLTAKKFTEHLRFVRLNLSGEPNNNQLINRVPKLL